MNVLKNPEIVPLNCQLYSSLSIDELEERLELDCWVYWGCNCYGTDCPNANPCPGDGLGGNCPEAQYTQ